MGCEIKIGIAGARGLSFMAAFEDIHNVKVTALCDIDNDVLESQAARFNIPRRYRVYEDMLMADIDAVIVATPMQFHVQQTIQALHAGKHVLSEVTAGVSFDELFWLVEEVEKSGKVYMMAENYLYIPKVQQVLAMAKAGLFGEPYYGEGEYLHNLSGIMTYPNGTPSWRQWVQLGVRGLFYPTHSLGPVMKWFGDDRVDFVVALGSGWHTETKYRQEDTSVALLQMKSGKLIRLRVDCVSNRPHAMTNYTLQGTKGAYESGRPAGEDMVYIGGGENPDRAAWEPLSNYDGYLPGRYKNATEKMLQAGHGGGDYFIIQDFLDAVNGKCKPAIDVYEACEWTAVGLLSALSVANKGKAMYMPNFRSGNKADKAIKF
jgi:predicted dehydrogenase